jgi:hypothetical protein
LGHPIEIHNTTATKIILHGIAFGLGTAGCAVRGAQGAHFFGRVGALRVPGAAAPCPTNFLPNKTLFQRLDSVQQEISFKLL